MSSRLPRSPHISHSTANGHTITASHAKSNVLAGVQDAYWSDDEAENLECPLCLEEMDLSDLHFKPCPCGYQICNFCWHHIKENLNGRCPACRREYTEQPAEFKSVTAEEQKRLNAQKRKRDKERKELEALNRRHFANVRIVQRNLVYVTGLGSRFAKEELIPSLRSSEYFGQYGKVSKILLVKRAATLNRGADVGVYITYHRREDAARAIAAVDGSPSPGGGAEIMRASYGTTKYCMSFLRGLQCTNNSCLDLHEWGDDRDCFTKEDLATLKHAMKDSETRQAPQAVPRKRAEEIEGAPTPPMGAALPRGASWGQNRGALPPAPAVVSPSSLSAFPAISATLPAAAQSSRQQRSSKARGAAASERPATPSRNRRSERRDRSVKPTETVSSSVSAVPASLIASRPSTPGLSNPPSRPSTASKSPRDAFKSPTLSAAQATPLVGLDESASTQPVVVVDAGSVGIKGTAPVQSQDVPAAVPALPPPPPGLPLPPPPPGLSPAPQHSMPVPAVSTRPPPSDSTPAHPQYQMSGAAKALLDDVRARRESAPPVSNQQSPFPDFDRTLSNLTAGGFSFSFNMGSNSQGRSDSASAPYPGTLPENASSTLPGRGVSGFFDPFSKSDSPSTLPPPPGLSAARGASEYEQSPLALHAEPRATYTGAFNPFADGAGMLNRSASYDSEKDAAERTSSRFGFARRQDSSGQISSGYNASATSSPMRLLDQLPPTVSPYHNSEASMSPVPSAQWSYHMNAPAEYGHPGISQTNMNPSPLHRQMYAPPGMGHPHYPNGMELNAAGLKELLNIGGNMPSGRHDTRRSQTDTFEPRFGSQTYNDPAIMSVAPQDMFAVGHDLPQMSHTSPPGLNGASQRGFAQSTMSMFQSPSVVPATAVASPPPGFAQHALRNQPTRQASQTNSPMTSIHGISVANSPAHATATIVKSEPISPILSASDFPALPAPSTESQPKRETHQPFLQSRISSSDAKSVIPAAKKAAGTAPKKSNVKPTIKPPTKTIISPIEGTSAPSVIPNSLSTSTKGEHASRPSPTEPEPTSKGPVIEPPTKRKTSRAQAKSPANAAPSTPVTSAAPKSNSVERSQSNAARLESVSNGVATTKNTPPTSAPQVPSIATDSAAQVPLLSRKQKKIKPVPRPVVKISRDEPAKTESVPPSAPTSPVSTLLRFEEGSSPPTPLTAEPASSPEPSIVGMLVDLASQYEIERLAFFDGQSHNSKLATPLRYGPLVQALSTLSMGGSSAAKTMTPGTIDTAVSSFQQLLETLTQTISDLLRMLPRTTWDDTSSFDGVLKDMLKAEEFLEENVDDFPNCKDDDVTVLTQALEKRARWMEIQLVKLEELHRDINIAAVRSVLDQNDRGWSPRVQEFRGDSLARFEQIGYVEDNGVRRAMSVSELEAALRDAKVQEEEADTDLKDAMLSAY
ncbi:hypothetical protein BDV93DRAFT_550121 [Ceratobasidium sp. AG-I]|nr:hypothetical protein BDV93DRAFT_550121 [Ceratobasidium sp. AG-I]